VIRVLLAEDQATTRGALAALLGLAGDIKVVPQAARRGEVLPLAQGKSAGRRVAGHRDAGRLDGLAAASQLRREPPGCKVLILTTFGRPGYLRRAMESGVVGLIRRWPPPP
jgi:two-component system response regulator DesR